MESRLLDKVLALQALQREPEPLKPVKRFRVYINGKLFITRKKNISHWKTKGAAITALEYQVDEGYYPILSQAYQERFLTGRMPEGNDYTKLRESYDDMYASYTKARERVKELIKDGIIRIVEEPVQEV